jgi:small subunit ribosomal protein S1
MAAHHVESPEQVVSPGDELWVKIIEIDTQRRRISLSIKQALEGGEVSEEYREAFGAHAYDDEGNYIGTHDYTDIEFTPETEAQAAWADYVQEAVHGHDEHAASASEGPAEASTDHAAPASEGAAEAPSEPPAPAVEDAAEASSGPAEAVESPEA